MGQFARSEVDELGLFFLRALFGQFKNDLAQVAQRLVDLAQLLETLSVSPCVFDPLAASQIHHVESAFARHLLVVFVRGFGANQCSEDSVRPGRLQVHVRGGNTSVFLPFLNHVHDFLEV